MGATGPGPGLGEKNVRTGYLFHGEELFPAREFLTGLKASLSTPDGEPASEDRYDLEETGWRDIVDSARNVPFFFSPWRLIVVEASKAGHGDLEKDEESVLREFFSAPTPRTVLVVLHAGKMAKTKALFKLFDALPESLVEIEEMKPLKESGFVEWTDRKVTALGKRIGSDAIDRLREIAGDDLRSLDSELEKLAAYIGDRKTIEPADVLAVTDGEREYKGYELTDALEKGDISQALVILDQQMPEGARGEMMLGTLAGFFRDIFLGRIGLRQGKDKKEIFREIRPNIKEFFSFYSEKIRNYFAVVEGLSEDEFVRLMTELERLDIKLKTTDSDAKTMFEVFFNDFGRAVRRPGLTSRRRG
jgi:DNA polymerase III subunit delta